jgi:hypothetical protein
MSAPQQGLSAGEKFGLVTLLVVGIAGDALIDALLRLDWHRLAIFAVVALSGGLLALSLALARNADEDWTPTRTEYLSRSDDERASR